MGRLEVLNKRQETEGQKGKTQVKDESDMEQQNEEKVVNIASSSWRNIINDRKNKSNKPFGKEPEPEPAGFFLDFGDAPEASAHVKEVIG
jgi:hypothetical protein